MSELSMRFLGTAELAIDGVPIQLRRRRSLALLAYLVLTGQAHTREALAALLSGEVDESQARKLLRNALTDLAEHGISAFLLIDRQTVAFDTPRPNHLDVALLDTLLDSPQIPDPVLVEQVIALWDQELLAGLVLRDAPQFESWLERERERRAGQLARIAVRLLEYHLHEGELGVGIVVARRLLAVRPWHEEIQRILMRLLARDDQRDAALEQFAICRDAVSEALGVEPQPETTALFEQLRAGPFTPRRNFAMPPPGLLGREGELTEIARLLGDPACRLLTISGLGGCGKTRLALVTATHLTPPVPLLADSPFPDGSFVVDLLGLAGVGTGGATVAERRLVIAIGLALGLVFYGNVDRLDQLVAYLRPKRMLLILDGLERLLPGVGVLQALLREAPGLNLLVTSRVRLGIPEEYVRELGGLALPDNADALDRAPAGQLFLREAQRLHARLTPEDRLSIAKICQLTGGLPLALVIAAGWLRALSCAEIARELEQGGVVFDKAPGHQPGERTSLRAIVAAAWQRLAPRERRALRQLAVFHGHFDRAACEALGVSLPVLLVLCDAALIERDSDDGYVVHQLVRRYGTEQLARYPAEEAQVRARHASYYAAILARRAAELLQRPGIYAAISLNRANLMAAWEWAVAHLDLGLLAQLRDGLAAWHQMVGLHREWAEVLAGAVERHRTALSDGEDPAVRVSLGWLLAAEANAWMWQGQLDRAYPLLGEARLCARTVGMIPLEVRSSLYEGRILHYQGETAAGAALLQQALTLSRALQDRRLEADSLLSLGLAAADLGRFVEAEGQLAQAEHAYRDLGDRLALGRLDVHRSRVYIARAEFVRARVSLEQSLTSVQAFGNNREAGWAQLYLGIVCDSGLGHHGEAEEHFERALGIAREATDLRYWTMVLWAQGQNAMHTGDFARASQCLEQALDLARVANSPVAITRAIHGLGLLAYAQGDEVTAEDRAQQALRLAIDTGRQPEQASTLLLLGQAQERLGIATVAAATYARAFTLAHELSIPAVCCDAATGLASVALAGEELGLAAEHAAAIVSYLREHNLAGCDEPGWTILTCYEALRAARDPQAEEVLSLGAALLQQRTAGLPDEWRSRYLEMFPARRDVLEQWREHQTTERRSRLPIRLLPVENLPAYRESLEHGSTP